MLLKQRWGQIAALRNEVMEKRARTQNTTISLAPCRGYLFLPEPGQMSPQPLPAKSRAGKGKAVTTRYATAGQLLTHVSARGFVPVPQSQDTL